MYLRCQTKNSSSDLLLSVEISYWKGALLEKGLEMMLCAWKAEHVSHDSADGALCCNWEKWIPMLTGLCL